MTLLLKLHYILSEFLKNLAEFKNLKVSVGRKPKVNDWEIGNAKDNGEREETNNRRDNIKCSESK